MQISLICGLPYLAYCDIIKNNGMFDIDQDVKFECKTGYEDCNIIRYT